MYFSANCNWRMSKAVPALEARAAGEISNLSEVWVGGRWAAASPVHVRASQRGMIEDVEPFKAQLNALLPRDPEVLDD